MDARNHYVVGTIMLVLATCCSSARLPHVKKTSEPLRVCEMAGYSLGIILADSDRWWPARVSFEDVFELWGGIPLAMFSGELFMCKFQGVATVNELINRLNLPEHQYLYKTFKFAYDYASLILNRARLFAMQYVENGGSNDMESPLDFYNHLQASGITELDPEGVAAFLDIIVAGYPEVFDDWEDPEPLSELPVREQCTRLTNDIRKMWNTMIKYSTHLEDPGTYYREQLYNVTGINLPAGPGAHAAMKQVVCDLMEPSTLTEMFRLLMGQHVIHSLVRFGYTQLSVLANQTVLHQGPNPSYYGNYHGEYNYQYGYDGADTSPGQSSMQSLYDFIQYVRDMGLLNLH